MDAPPTRYRNLLMDNARWDSVELREGDIIVSTPAKCGTTWMQIICGLLVFGRPRLPASLDELSLWPDAYFERLEVITARLAAQEHRRFMKTHVPLDGLPRAEGVTYICVGRDPRDVGISLDNHMANVDLEVVMKIRMDTLGPDLADAGDDLPPPAPTQYERFWNWVETDDILMGLEAMVAHVQGFWEHRDDSDVVLTHYADLKSDLEGQMRRLAGVLGIEIPEDRWPELVRAATFDQVRANAETLAPEGRIWRDKAKFFNKGSSGQWKDLLDEDDLGRYRERIAALATPELAEWLHRGPV